MTVPGSSQILALPPLQGLDWLVGGLITRQDDLDLERPKGELRAELDRRHAAVLKPLGIEWSALRRVDQVHGNRVMAIDPAGPVDTSRVPADGLIAAAPGPVLAVHVADCCPIFLIEQRCRAIGLLHSGRRGTEANIAREGVRALLKLCGGTASRLRAVLGPCIHACCYEIDLVSQIRRQLAAEGVAEVWCHPDCTGCHTDRYYSYRREQGRTGRMLAFLTIQRL